MSWIKIIEYKKASGYLKNIYDRIKGPHNTIDNVLTVHSLRPHTLVGHMALYKNVLHNSNNSLPKWYLETLGVYTSLLNHCDYCVEHHSAGLSRLLNNSKQYSEIINCLEKDTPQKYFKDQYLAGLKYTKKLTKNLHLIIEEDIHTMRDSGLNDGEILEINQVVSYFNYVNRSVIGLGVDSKGDIIGLSPKDNNDTDNWNHS